MKKMQTDNIGSTILDDLLEEKKAPESPKSVGYIDFETNIEENEKMKLMFKEFYAAQSKKEPKPEVSYIHVY